MCRSAEAIFFLVLLCFISACASKPYAVDIANEKNESGKLNKVYVVDHGWHTGFVLVAPDIQSSIPELGKRFGSTRYIEIGWGDKGFYQAEEITAAIIFRAIVWPSESVVHAVAVPGHVQDYFYNSEIEILYLEDDAYSSLLKFISNSFKRNEAGELLEQAFGIYGDSQFYTGTGYYFLMNTCNVWTAKGLKSAGLEISPIFKLTASSVMNELKSHNNLQVRKNHLP